MAESSTPERIDKAYVIGAGFSRAFNLPLVNQLLGEVTAFCQEQGEGQRDTVLPGQLEEFKRRFFPFFSCVEGYEPNVVDMFIALGAAKDLKATNVELAGLDDIDPEDTLERLRKSLCQIFHRKLADAVSCGDVQGDFFREIAERAKEFPAVFVSLNWDNFLERGLYQSNTRIWFSDKLEKKPHVRVFKPHGSVDWMWRQKGDTWLTDMYWPLGSLLYKPEGKRSSEREIVHRSADVSRLKSIEEPKPAWRTIRDDPREPQMITMGHGKGKTMAEDRFKRIREAWKRAGNYLERAKEIVIIGYSMPEDDVEVRLLLRGAIWRYEKLYGTRPSVKIVNPDKGAWQRFREALSLDCELDMRPFEPDMVI